MRPTPLSLQSPTFAGLGSIARFGGEPNGRRLWFSIALVLAWAGSISLRADVLTYQYDNGRTGLNSEETQLTPKIVNANNFGLRFSCSVDGKVDAWPLAASSVNIPNVGVRNVLYVATEHDSLYAFDADLGTKLWQVSFLRNGEVPSDNHGTDQISPEIGVTATPVIDRTMGSSGTIYLVTMTKDLQGKYHQRLHALDLATGSETLNGPVEITASYPGNGLDSNNGRVLFDPAQYAERCALLLSGGVIYTTWTSHADKAPYTGWIIGYDQSNLSQAKVLNIDPSGTESGNSFWMSGSGPAADENGNIYANSANGPFDTTFDTNGFPANGDFGDSLLEFSPDNGLTVEDFFTPYDQQNDQNGDIDLGSGGVLLVPDILDASGRIQHLAVSAGKDSNLYVVDRDNLGRFNSGGNQIYQELKGALHGGEWASPAYFNGSLYYGPVGNHLLSFTFSGGKLGALPSSQSPGTFSYPGTTPSVSSNGNRNGIVWAYENKSGTAVLHAYDASNLSNELYNSTQASNGRDSFGKDNKFIAPMIYNGKVYAATTNSVAVFGLFNTTAITDQEGFVNGDPSIALNGGASITGSALQLTDGRPGEIRSAFYKQVVNIQQFTSDFTFQLTNAVADGFTFTIQNVGPTSLGSPSYGGGGLGYAGTAKSVAVKFDLYNNSGEGTNSSGIYTNGAPPTTPSVNLDGQIDLHRGDLCEAHLSYDGATLAVSIVDTVTGQSATYSAAIDIPATVGSDFAYVGFSGGTGRYAAVQRILKWNYSPHASNYESGFTPAGLSLNGGAVINGSALTLTDGRNNEARSAFCLNPVDVRKFDTEFVCQLTNASADGFTFAIQNSAANKVGAGGGGLGYAGVGDSVAVKFDLYSNSGEGVNSTGLFVNGASPTTPATSLSSAGIDLHRGDPLDVHLSYDGATMVVTETDLTTGASAYQSYNINIPQIVGGNTAFLGFTAGTGGQTATQQILKWTY